MKEMIKPLLYYSTNLHAEKVVFRQALLKGQAPDLGLYMPEHIPVIPSNEILAYAGKPYYKIAWDVTRRFLEGEMPEQDLLEITRDCYDFEVPLEKVMGRKYIMRLDRGPTASFKDFAARMMGRLMQYSLKQEHNRLLILTATSGDTGSAVSNAFFGLDNIDVVVLFPENEVTARQRKQMTTLGNNIRSLALDAKFDECQSLVKKAFADPGLDHLPLSSANSINIGRLLPQIVYYFYAYAQLASDGEKAIYSIPSGNFGDMMGGVMAMKMGLPVKKFVIATNGNDEFPRYLYSGIYQKVVPSRNCISSAMNVGHPSNLARLVALYGGVMDETGVMVRDADMEQMREDLFAISVDDDETRRTIADAWKDHQILLEPHGAVGWAGLKNYLNQFPEDDTPGQLCISLETAHPAKFPEEIRKITGIDPELPASLQGIDTLPEHVVRIGNDYSSFRTYLHTGFPKT
ncbi:MAG TPA: threonine synthase [Bacteroidales bacterium]|nr:threonine synthase [Bacteroidales bacterium]HPS72768.1 threonine synthase [Bacteroidales bacterium]